LPLELQVGQFPIDEDAQRLESACRGMQVPAPRRRPQPPTAVLPRRLQQHAGHVAGPLQGSLLPRRHQQRCHAFRFRLVAVVAQCPGQLGRTDGRQHLRGRPTSGAIHAHVQRTIPRVGKPALGVVDLHARHPQVRQQAVDPLDALLGEDPGHTGEVGVVQAESAVRYRLQPRAGSGQIVRVQIETEQASAGCDALQQLHGVAGVACRAVDDDRSESRGQSGQDLGEEDGNVLTRRCAPRSAGHGGISRGSIGEWASGAAEEDRPGSLACPL
jgi:hypothetical protein